MLKHLSKIIFMSIVSLSTANAALEMSPPNNGSGLIPNGYEEILFTLKDGQWAKNISFPTKPENNDTVTIKSDASYESSIDGSRTTLPLTNLNLKTGQYYKFRYNSSKKK